jgi:phenylpyruvate tautomerase PptA (4-oxalocrotonate tautomerase family)
MPKLDLTYPAGALDADVKRDLATDYTADGQAELSHFVVDVTVPAGGLSERRKGGFVEEASKLVREAAGLGEEDGVRVWVLIHEVPEGNWGAAGQIVRFEQLRAAARAEREKAEQPA